MMVTSMITWGGRFIHHGQQNSGKSLEHILGFRLKIKDGKLKTEDSVTSGLCPCDMTGGICDVYCCCDDDCSKEAFDAFACDTTMRSGESPRLLHEWKCDNIKAEKDFQFGSFLCVQKENSPYLGHYFPSVNIIKDLPSLNLLLSKQRKTWKNVAVSDISVANKLGAFRTSTGYVFEQNLEVQMISPLGNQDVKFLFPYSIYNGKCDLIHPVRFLRDLTSSCNTKIGSVHDFLRTNSLFSVNTFLIGNISDRNLLSFPSNKTVFVNVTTVFQHAVNPCCYLTTANCTVSTVCTKNVTISHDGFYRPLCSNGKCRNVVQEVEYIFFWKGQKLVWLNIAFTLVDVPLINDQGFSAFLTQHFSTKYIYQSAFNISDMIVDSTVLMRSGKYGYEIGLPLIGSTLVHNESNETNSDQDTSAGNKTFLYIPTYDISGDCISKKVNFGEDIFAGCLFHLKLTDFSNCANIRGQVSAVQSQVLHADMISRFGDPDFHNTEDFVQVLQKEFSENTTSDYYTEEMSEQGLKRSCDNIKNHVELHVLYTVSQIIRDQPVFRVVGAVRRYETNTWDYTCDVYGVCHENESFPFTLTASVRFSFISSEKNRKIKRFWSSSAPIRQCKEEICWEDIFYPLKPSFTLSHVTSAANNCFIVLLFLLSFAWLKIRHS